MHYRKLNKDWKVIEERIKKRLASWKGEVLYLGGHLVLINSVLSSLPMFANILKRNNSWFTRTVTYI
jgi:hypothetical protein